MAVSARSVDPNFSFRAGDYVIKPDDYSWLLETWGHPKKKNPETGEMERSGEYKVLIKEYPASLRQGLCMMMHKLVVDQDVHDCAEIIKAIDNAVEQLKRIAEEV